MPTASTEKEVAKFDKKVVQLLPSALFFTASNTAPKGIRGKDLPYFVQGMVEERSPMPLEQTSWGFICDFRKRGSREFLLYAAPRELLFPGDKNSSMRFETKAVLPTFAALHGLRFSSPTWLFLREEECLTAAFFEKNQPNPSFVQSRFIFSEENKEKNFEELHDKLRKSLPVEDGHTVLDDLIRVGQAEWHKTGLKFTLEIFSRKKDQWLSWKTTNLGEIEMLMGADVRNRSMMLEYLSKNSAQKRILQVAVSMITALFLLALFEGLQFRQSAKAEELRALSVEQQPKMDRLQEIESMAQSLQDTIDREFEPYRWLMVLNAKRPETISFNNFSMDENGRIRFHGEAPSVQAINQFYSTLKENLKLESVTLSNVESGSDGVRFQILVETGNRKAEPSSTREESDASAIEDEVKEEEANQLPEQETEE